MQNAETLAELITRLGLTVSPESEQGTPTVVPGQYAGSARTPNSRLGRYPVTGHLGAGGMGDVLQVHDPDIGRQLAAKVIRGRADSESLAKFILEAQVTGQLEHPNIVPLYELGMTPDQQVYFTMKRVEGRTLADVLAAPEAEPNPTESPARSTDPRGEHQTGRRLVSLLQIILKVCDALAFAHSRGVIHRDLKPANIMVGRFGEVQLMDWGLAKVVGQTDRAQDGLTLKLGGGHLAELARKIGGQPLATLDGTICGTPQYMPPEQARGEIDKLDERADIYAVGAMLYQMLTGRPPYEGEDAWSIVEQVVEGPPPVPSAVAPEGKIPWELEAVVTQAMAPTREARYQNIHRLKRDLEAWLEGRVLGAADYSSWQVVKKWAGRNKAAVTAAAGIALAVLVAFIGISWQLREARLARDGEKTQKEAAIKARKAETKEKEQVQAERQKVASEKARADQKVADFESMSDVKLIVELTERLADLGPQRWKLDALRGWLVEAQKMRDRLPRHEQVVSRLKRQPRLSGSEKWQLGLVDKLVQELKPFVKQLDKVVRWERAAAQAGTRRTKFPQRWVGAIAAIRREPIYRGLLLKIQEGLLPLRTDAKSGLWEFAHLSSGDLPVQGKDRKWTISGKTCVVLVLQPGGRFRMGQTRALDPQAQRDERPGHDVRLAPFFIGKYELTQGQWMRLTDGPNPSEFKPPATFLGQQDAVTLAHPVEQVSWQDCRTRLARVGLMLPTEAQWEYAARARTPSVWWTGNDKAELKRAANLADLTYREAGGRSASNEWRDGYAVHAPVGRFLPNGFGLHDVIGNLYEWCRDPYLEAAYHLQPKFPDGWRDYPDEAFKAPRVARGGGWNGNAINARSAYRYRHAATARSSRLGVRAARGIH